MGRLLVSQLLEWTKPDYRRFWIPGLTRVHTITMNIIHVTLAKTVIYTHRYVVPLDSFNVGVHYEQSMILLVIIYISQKSLRRPKSQKNEVSNELAPRKKHFASFSLVNSFTYLWFQVVWATSVSVGCTYTFCKPLVPLNSHYNYFVCYFEERYWTFVWHFLFIKISNIQELNNMSQAKQKHEDNL